MPGIMDPKIEKYLDTMLPARDRILRDMEFYAARNNVPIIGPACGRLLYLLARTIKAKRVFELGSAIGYSTIWLARAVGPGGKVYYSDSDPANARRAEDNLRRAGVLKQVEILVGDALKLFESTQGQFDLIFNDVNKHQYPEVFRRTLPRLRKGGLFITDNVLWSGRVAKPLKPKDQDTRAILKFNRLICRNPALFTTIIPLRDGMAVCEKLG